MTLSSGLPLPHLPMPTAARWNSRGSGARCFARFVRLKGLVSRDRIAVSGTARGRITLQLEGENRVTVNMGVPQFEAGQDPVPCPEGGRRICCGPRITPRDVRCVSMGNPHCVIEVPSVADAPVETLGPIMERHERFPERVNVGFMEWSTPARSKLRVLSAGGETPACGTGPVQPW